MSFERAAGAAGRTDARDLHEGLGGVARPWRPAGRRASVGDRGAAWASIAGIATGFFLPWLGGGGSRRPRKDAARSESYVPVCERSSRPALRSERAGLCVGLRGYLLVDVAVVCRWVGQQRGWGR